jgi:hypothetical protein
MARKTGDTGMIVAFRMVKLSEKASKPHSGKVDK